MDVSKLLETNITLDVVRTSPSKKMCVLTSGEMKTMPDGKLKPTFVVEIDEKQLNWIPNKTTLKNVSEKYGKETQQWVGKLITLEVGQVNNKDAIIGRPV